MAFIVKAAINCPLSPEAIMGLGTLSLAGRTSLVLMAISRGIKRLYLSHHILFYPHPPFRGLRPKLTKPVVGKDVVTQCLDDLPHFVFHTDGLSITNILQSHSFGNALGNIVRMISKTFWRGQIGSNAVGQGSSSSTKTRGSCESFQTDPIMASSSTSGLPRKKSFMVSWGLTSSSTGETRSPSMASSQTGGEILQSLGKTSNISSPTARFMGT